MKSIAAIAIFLLLPLVVIAQNPTAAKLTLNPHPNNLLQEAHASVLPSVPTLCNPCVFYGGDFNSSDGNAQAFANENTLSAPNTATYAAVDVPKNVHGVITGILFMEVATLPLFDPATAPYDIRTGVSEGSGGTSVASGTADMSYSLYGQCQCDEFQTAVNLVQPLTVVPGTRYWFNLQPQCTNGDCNGVEYYLANTTQKTNGLHSGAQPPDQMFFNSEFFGFTWTNWCDSSLGQTSQACQFASFGLMGHS